MSEILPEIVVIEAPSSADRDAIHKPVVAYNDTNGPPSGLQPLAIVLRDPAGERQ